MTSGAVIFLDAECTGLSLDDDIWEIAARRREPDGRETEFHCFVEHSAQKCARLPEPFYSDHHERYETASAVSPREAGLRLLDLIGDDRPHIVGAVPNFDTERIALLLRRWGLLGPADREPWHHHLIDIENLAVGYLYGRYGPRDGGPPVEAEGEAVALPWDSDALSCAVGVTPPAQGEGRHTAMGDVLWTRAVYDAITIP